MIANLQHQIFLSLHLLLSPKKNLIHANKKPNITFTLFTCSHCLFTLGFFTAIQKQSNNQTDQLESSICEGRLVYASI